jgi:hypothetical protein
VLVQPATVARWHRERLRRCGCRRSGRRPGRPRIDSEVRALIRRMAVENRLWGAPRIHGELLTLGIAVSERTVSRYLGNTRIAPSQTWRTFLANHFDQLAYTSPVMFCGARDEDDDIDPRGGLPRRGSVSGERSYVCDQWSPVLCHLSSQRTSVDRRIGQAHVHHRRCEHPSSGNDPPEAQAVVFDAKAYRRRLHSSGALHEAVGARRSWPARRTRVAPHHVLSVQSRRQNRLEGRNILRSSLAKRTCACDSDRRRSIGESHPFHRDRRDHPTQSGH